VCGLVTEGVGIDTSVMQKQFEELLSTIQEELYNLNYGTEVLLKSGGVPTPEKSDQAANKGYVDLSALSVTGGTMEGPINMNGQKLSGLNAPTANDQAANKGYVDLKAYPVGSIYMSVKSTSPASLFGGTWEQLKDRFLLGAGSSYSAGATGGSATHKLTVNEMPSHTHNLRRKTAESLSSGTGNAMEVLVNVAYTDDAIYGAKATGGNAAHNNMPPYLVVYMWKRTA
jgi:hypothetical protein